MVKDQMVVKIKREMGKLRKTDIDGGRAIIEVVLMS